MNIIEMDIDKVIPYENNPRKNDEAVDKVALSISAFGFKVPIVLDANNVVVTGHTRLKAAKKLGLSKVPCILADDLTEEQIRAFRLADNKVAEFSQWDEDKLMQELESLGEIDMSLYGFAFPEDEDDENAEDDTYTDKTNIPQYDITGDVPDLSELVNEDKTNELFNSSGALTVCFAQGGDFIGGIDNPNFYKGLLRKAMNSFFCKVDNPIDFRGTMNEDVTTYTTLGSRGELLLTVTKANITQKPTQSLAGGMSEVYQETGTYMKSFYSVMSMPSAVKVSAMGDKHTRIHHKINWQCCVPKILNERWKKNASNK